MTYTIIHSAARTRRGLPGWGVFQEIEPGFSLAVSIYETEEQAKAGLARLERAPKGWDIAETSVEG